MKTNYFATLGLMLISLFWLGSCDDNIRPCIDPIGPVIAEDRFIDGFTEVHNALSAVIHIEQGEEWLVTVVARESIVDRIETNVKGDQLVIETRYCLRGGDIEIFITMPEIDKIANSGSGVMFGDNTWTGDYLEIDNAGSGRIEAEVFYNTIDQSIAGSGRISLQGECEMQYITIAGSGRIQNFDLFSEVADISISGSGRCDVFVTDQLDVSISGSGSVYYTGNPSVSTNITGSGRIVNAN